MTEGIYQLPVPGPAGMDVLSGVLQLFRLSGSMLLRGEFTAPWALDAPQSSALADLLHPGSSQLVIFHIVAEGQCWVEGEGIGRQVLNAGDVVMFPHGHAHLMGSYADAAPVPIGQLFPTPPWTELPILCHGGGGSATQIVCVYLRCDQLLSNPFLSSLPPMLCARPLGGAHQEWFRASVRYLIEETRGARPGVACLSSRLTELLFIEILRMYIAEAGTDAVGWLAALADRYLSRCLQAMHARPDRAWTLNELAQQTGLSRTALTVRFRRYLGQSPMQYLNGWRLQVAAQRLQSTQDPLAAIAEEVGYGSEEAFSRAFKRGVGLPPATWRRERQRVDQAAPA